jgi:hypothetical protein
VGGDAPFLQNERRQKPKTAGKPSLFSPFLCSLRWPTRFWQSKWWWREEEERMKWMIDTLLMNSSGIYRSWTGALQRQFTCWCLLEQTWCPSGIDKRLINANCRQLAYRIYSKATSFFCSKMYGTDSVKLSLLWLSFWNFWKDILLFFGCYLIMSWSKV